MCEHDTTAEHSNISPTGLFLVSTSSLFSLTSSVVTSLMVPPIVSERYCSALERASNLAIDINPTALPAVRQQIKVSTEWLSMVRRLRSVHNPDPKVQTSP